MTMRLLSLALAAMLVLAGPALAQDARDRSFGPGRVGAIKVGITKPADLAKIYGAANVKEQMIGYEGGESPGAHVFPGSADFLIVVFDDGRTRVDYVEIAGKNWVSRSGLRNGITLAQLEHFNGGWVDLQGFGADEAGRVYASGAAVRSYTVYIALNGPAPEVMRTDGVFSSRHPALKPLRPTVSFIRVDRPAN
jgi:hypothetical protein